MTTPNPTRDGLWLDDLVEGATFTTDTHELTAEEIVAFARDFDPQPFHTDADVAAGTFFDGLVASGWHTAAITMRLVVTSGPPIATGIVGGAPTWPGPARPGPGTSYGWRSWSGRSAGPGRGRTRRGSWSSSGRSTSTTRCGRPPPHGCWPGNDPGTTDDRG